MSTVSMVAQLATTEEKGKLLVEVTVQCEKGYNRQALENAKKQIEKIAVSCGAQLTEKEKVVGGNQIYLAFLFENEEKIEEFKKSLTYT